MLRNTRWVYGVAVFTGHETKLMKNASKTPIKTTRVESMVNQHIIYLFFILVIMAVVCALGTLKRQLGDTFELQVLLMNPSRAWIKFPANILTYVILFNNLIPMR